MMQYVLIKAKDHPNARKSGYIKRSRLIMSNFLERPLSSKECVHHINGDKADDRIENLVVMTQKAHTVLHSKSPTACNRKTKTPKTCPNCGSQFIHKWNHIRDRVCSIKCRAEYYKKERGGNTRITQKIANKIKQLKGIIGSRKIALVFGISPTHIKRILRGDIWAE